VIAARIRPRRRRIRPASLPVATLVSLLALSPFAPARVRAASEPSRAAPRVADLGWLSGCWAAEGGEPGSGETWTSPAGGTMLGLSRTVRSGRTVAWEFLEIRESGESGLILVAHPSGQERTVFELLRVGDEEIVFENPEHDFPQRVLYRKLDPDRLLGRAEAERDGETVAADFPMRRTACDPDPARTSP